MNSKLAMKIKQKLFFLTFILSVSSCDGTKSGEFQKTFEDKLQSALNDITKSSAPSLEEVEKLSQVEYHVEVFPLESDSSRIKTTLNTLGKDRWDCFSSLARPGTEPKKPEMVVLCKRMPETVLRYVPRSLIGR